MKVDGAECSDRPVRTATEDVLVGDGETGGLGRLDTHTQTHTLLIRMMAGMILADL